MLWDTDPRFNQVPKTWTIDRTDGATSFQNCAGAVQRNVYSRSTSTNTAFDPDLTFDPIEFASYMGRIERQFNCAGWCNVAYIHPVTNRATMISKYLFSDINRGVPNTMGCIGPVLNWLPSYLTAVGAIAIVAFGIQLLVFLLALLLAMS
jgi:hypothetical protein